MDQGYIKIEKNEQHEFVVDAKLINGNLWLTKNQIAGLFNVFVNTISNNLQAIFNSGILHKNDVINIHTVENNGHKSEIVFYNFETLILLSYRTTSLEAGAFRQWVMKALIEYNKCKERQVQEVLITYNPDKDLSLLASLN